MSLPTTLDFGALASIPDGVMCNATVHCNWKLLEFRFRECIIFSQILIFVFFVIIIIILKWVFFCVNYIYYIQILSENLMRSAAPRSNATVFASTSSLSLATFLVPTLMSLAALVYIVLIVVAVCRANKVGRDGRVDDIELAPVRSNLVPLWRFQDHR